MCLFLQYYSSVRRKGLEYFHKAIVSDAHRTRWEDGDWTDDSDQMILIMLSIIDQKGEVGYSLMVKHFDNTVEPVFRDFHFSLREEVSKDRWSLIMCFNSKIHSEKYFHKSGLSRQVVSHNSSLSRQWARQVPL